MTDNGPAFGVGLPASLTQLVGKWWDDAQALVREGKPRDAAARLATSALQASADAGRQAETLLRALAARPARFLAALEIDAGRLTEAISDRFGVASRDELAELRRRLAALDRKVEALTRESGTTVARAPFPLTSELS